MIKKGLAISDTGFVFDPVTGDSFSLNNVALDIILFFKEQKTKEEIQALIMQKYEIDQDSFENDYYDFLKLLQQYKLLDNEVKA